MRGIEQPRVAVIGCGHWGKNLVRVFSELGALGGVCEKNTLKYTMSGVLVWGWPEICRSDFFDAVAIATPAKTHYQLAKEALLAGKHVFIEKPMCLSVGDGEELCEIAEQEKRVLMVGHLMQYHPAFVMLRKLDIGPIRRIETLRFSNGIVREDESVVWSFAPHDVSIILALLGDPVKVERAKTYPDDITWSRLVFPDAEAEISVSWSKTTKIQRLTIEADKSVLFDDGREPKLMVDGEPVPVIPAEPLRLECEHFLDCIQKNKTPRTDGREGLRVLKVLEAIDPPHRAHETAVVESKNIGPGTKIWHFSHILPGVKVGRDCVIGQNVMIGPDVTIGDGCKIQNNVSIYDGVTLEDDVFLGPSCVFTNVRAPRAFIDRKAEFQPTRIGRGASIGANATILCGNDIGEYAMVAAGAVVTHDVPPYALVAGVPARRVGTVNEDGTKAA